MPNILGRLFVGGYFNDVGLSAWASESMLLMCQSLFSLLDKLCSAVEKIELLRVDSSLLGWMDNKAVLLACEDSKLAQMSDVCNHEWKGRIK